MTDGGSLTVGSINVSNTNRFGVNLFTIASTGTLISSSPITVGNDIHPAPGTLNVGGALGTASAPLTGLTVQAGGVLAGYGTITVPNTGSNVINVTNGTIRGGFDDGVNQLGTLTIAPNSGTTSRVSLAIQSSGASPSGLGLTGALETEVLATSTTAATNSTISITGANKELNLNTIGSVNGGTGSGFGQINIVVYDPTASLQRGPVSGTTYTFVLATVATAGKIQLGGSSAPANSILDTGTTLGAGSGSMGNADLYIVGASSAYTNSVTAWSLFVDPTGKNLELSVTSTPEPEHILLMCVGVLLAGFAIRRRWRGMGSAAASAA